MGEHHVLFFLKTYQTHNLTYFNPLHRLRSGNVTAGGARRSKNVSLTNVIAFRALSHSHLPSRCHSKSTYYLHFDGLLWIIYI